jgi:hypothetical protein
MKAWLVTWDWTGDYAKVNNPIIAVLSSRRSAKSVLELVEFVYTSRHFTWNERLEFARNKKAYLSLYLSGFVNGTTTPWGGSLMFGRNPFIYARVVDDIKVQKDENGKEELIWNEPKLSART